MPDPRPARTADVSDAMAVVGALLVVAAVAALAGGWWAVGLLGVLLAVAGLVRAA